MAPYDDTSVGRVLEPWNQHDIYGTNGRLCVSAKNNPGQVRAIDGLGNCAPEVSRAEPVLLVRRQRRLAHLVEPHLLAVERCTRIVHELRRG